MFEKNGKHGEEQQITINKDKTGKKENENQSKLRCDSSNCIFECGESESGTRVHTSLL